MGSNALRRKAAMSPAVCLEMMTLEFPGLLLVVVVVVVVVLVLVLVLVMVVLAVVEIPGDVVSVTGTVILNALGSSPAATADAVTDGVVCVGMVVVVVAVVANGASSAEDEVEPTSPTPPTVDADNATAAENTLRGELVDNAPPRVLVKAVNTLMEEEEVLACRAAVDVEW